jgi:signal peptidase
MSRNPIIMLAMLLAVSIILNVLRPGGLMSYLLPSICWTTIAVAALVLGRVKEARTGINRRITLMAFLVSAFQIFIFIDAGLITGFGKSPLSFTPRAIAANLTLVATTLLGTELSRAYLARNLSRKRPTLTLGVLLALYTIINVSVFALINVIDPLAYSEFLGTGFLPVLSENLLATYLALLSGAAASIAYRGPIQAFQWFSPLLPDLPWAYSALIGVMAPVVGFMFVSQATTQRDLIKAGILTRKKLGKGLSARTRQTSVKGWLALAISFVLVTWASTGLLGFYPTTVISGSMRPTIDVGDIAITMSVDPSKIQIGDVIQFWSEEAMIIHRVTEIQEVGGMTQFITKGDANPISDTNPVHPTQIRGKLIYIVPKLGWVSIYFKTGVASIWAFYSSKPAIAYATIIIAILATLSYSVHTHKNRSSKFRYERRW